MMKDSMTIYKKTRAIAACLLMFLIIPAFSGCIVVIPSDWGSAGTDKEDGIYINGELVDILVPESGSYFYNQLTEAEKTIYTAALNALETGVCEFSIAGVDCDEYSDGCARSIKALLRERPEFFWIDGGSKINVYQIVGSPTGELTVTLSTHKYWDGKDIQSAASELEEVTDAIIQQANEYPDPYEKAKFVTKWLAEHVEYDKESVEKSFEINYKQACIIK